MILYKAISTFHKRIDALLKVRRGVYAGVVDEMKREFNEQSIEQIRQNRDMILMEGDMVIIKLRLPDKVQRLSRKDGYRLIYLVSKVQSLVVFLDIYPKNGPMQRLDISNDDLKRLIMEFVTETEDNLLQDYPL